MILQERYYSQQPQRKGFFQSIIDNVRQDFEKNKELKVCTIQILFENQDSVLFVINTLGARHFPKGKAFTRGEIFSTKRNVKSDEKKIENSRHKYWFLDDRSNHQIYFYHCKS